MKVSDIVFQNYQGIRRYGVVTNLEARKNNWSFAKVKWFNDEKYESAMDFINEMRGGDHYYHEYRIDELVVVEPSREVDSLKKCTEYAERNL